ncbi:hypothetical protein BDZ94DRAFT_1149000, partial [Collybia nuda]
SVPIEIIQRWEHQMKCWMDVYEGGLRAKEAQIQDKKFFSTCYTSHRCIPETVAQAFD